MLFNSVTFVLFFCWVLLVHYLPIKWSFKKAHLLLASYVFYAAWNPPFIALLLLSTVVDWKVAEQIYKQTEQRKRKRWLWLSLAINLGMLGMFKYAGFMLNNFNEVMHALGIEMQFADPGLILPLGISFFTFQTLSYTLDVYHKKMKPWDSFRDYALFVSFFPQLVAGPIVRAKQFLPQTRKQTYVSFDAFSVGLCFFIIGLFQKVVMADAMFAPLADQVFGAGAEIDQTSLWLGSLFFTAQIFCDFSGYSLCAIGVAHCLGFTLPINFKSPLVAMGFADFWHRWHISLSTWLRDYVYIPLGGNRLSRFKHHRNLMLTFLLGGLWHGAAWNFIVWGAIHGMLLIVEDLCKRNQLFTQLYSNFIARGMLLVITFLGVVLTFVVFRADSLGHALAMITGLFINQSNVQLLIMDMWMWLVIGTLVGLLLIQFFMRNKTFESCYHNMPVAGRALILSLCLMLIFISSGNSDAFIYFQF